MSIPRTVPTPNGSTARVQRRAGTEGEARGTATRLEPSPEVRRRPFWMRTPRGSRWAWLHLPAGVPTRPGGVVICPPFGFEYIHSYRALRRLAERLASAGFPVLRFDHHASGSSTGSPVDHDVLAAWLEDIEVAAALIRDLTGQHPPSLVGLRLGTLLGLAAAERFDIEHFVAWAPVTSGRLHAREQLALAGSSRTGTGRDASVVEPAGFVLARSTLQDLKGLEARQLQPRVTGGVLVLERDDAPAPSGLGQVLTWQGVAAEVRETEGYPAMMEKPHSSVVPEAVVDCIVDWLGRHGGGRRPPARAALPQLACSANVGPSTEEELLYVPGARPLFAVLTTPSGAAWQRRPLLLLSNAGSAHTAGPNRIYVEIARSLAAAGIATLRLDLGNLGDSIRGVTPDENHPYPPTALGDLRQAVEWLRDARGVQRVVVGGLCSGAYHAFVCGQDPDFPGLVGLLMINPLTFDWAPGDSLKEPGDARYHASVRDPKKWRKLRNGAYDASTIRDFLLRAARERGRDFGAGLLEHLGLVPPRKIGRALLQMATARRTIDFVFSRFDPGHELLQARAGAVVRRLEREGALSLTLIDGADHSFTLSEKRRALVRAMATCLLRYPTLPRTLEATLHAPSH